MRWANAASVPEIRSPKAVATSLAERATSACRPCSTVIDPPGAMPSFEAGFALAFCEKGTGEDRVRRPAFSSSKTM